MIEIKNCNSLNSNMLFSFFEEIKKDEKYFHPHEFTVNYAKKICAYEGQDLYYSIVLSDKIVGYGMLRGWDEGFKTPSLGIIISKEIRGSGIGKMFMCFLHSAARLKGANVIMLKVYSDNEAAYRLYKSIGYVFDKIEGNE